MFGTQRLPMAKFGLVSDKRNSTDMWLKGILTAKNNDDYPIEEVKTHDFNLNDDEFDDKDELPNAMEFVSVECNMLFDEEVSIGDDPKLSDTNNVRKKKHKSKKKKSAKPSKKNGDSSVLDPIPLISELFRYRSVDVYKRAGKGQFVKIFSSDTIQQKNDCDIDSAPVIDHCDDSNSKNVKDQECDVCGRQVVAQDLDTHIYQEHMEGNFFKCEVCPKKFIDKKHLIVHRILHVNVEGKPYPCPFCKERFTNKTALKTHSHTHVQSVNEVQQVRLSSQSFQMKSQSSYIEGQSQKPAADKKDFQCKHCPKSFTYKVQCTSHEKLHSSSFIKCENCENNITVKQILSHQKKFPKGTPYQCEKCGVSFRIRSSMLPHKKSRTGQKTRECPDCGMVFWKSSALKKHRKSYHE